MSLLLIVQDEQQLNGFHDNRRLTMKTCEKCGEEIATKDGENLCPECEQEQADKAKRAKRNAARRERESVLRDLGMVKVRGALGGTYWE